MKQLLGGLGMLRTERIDYCGSVIAVAGLQTVRGLDQAIRDAAHGGDDNDDGARAGGISGNLRGTRNTGRIAHRSATEFHHSQRGFHRDAPTESVGGDFRRGASASVWK